MGQHAADPLVEDLDFELPHLRGGSRPATCSTSARLELRAAAERMLALRVVERDGAIVAPERLLGEVADDHGQLLLRQLRSCVLRQVLAFRGKAHAERRPGSAATQARISGFSSSSSDRCPFAFLIFCAAGFLTR